MGGPGRRNPADSLGTSPGIALAARSGVLGLHALLLSLSLAAAALPAPPDLPARLVLADAERLLLERGLDLLVAEAQVRGAEGDVDAAAALPNPELSLGYGRSFSGGAVLPDPQYAAGLSDGGALAQLASGKRGLRRDVARSALAAARAGRDEARRGALAQLRIAFAQAVVAREALRYAGEARATNARTLELTRARDEAGAISEADLARVEVAALEADRAADAAAGAYRDARVALAFLLGARGPVPDFEVEGPELLHPPRAALGEAPTEELLARARARRPDLAQALRQRERTEAAVELARRQRIPDVTLSVSYVQQGTLPTSTTPPTLTGGIAFPIPVLHFQGGEIRRAEADRDAAALTAARAEAQVVSDVETALADWRAAAARLRRMEDALLARARRARDLVEVQWRRGAATLLDLLDAQRTFLSVQGEYLADLGAAWSAAFRLAQAVGEDAP